MACDLGQEHKLIKIKAAVKLYQNPEPSIRAVQMFYGKAAKKEHSSLVTETYKFGDELGTSLTLKHSDL